MRHALKHVDVAKAQRSRLIDTITGVILLSLTGALIGVLMGLAI